jgi:hypothetical protein
VSDILSADAEARLRRLVPGLVGAVVYTLAVFWMYPHLPDPGVLWQQVSLSLGLGMLTLVLVVVPVSNRVAA